MNIYIDKRGIIRYLSQWVRNIWIDNNCSNKSVHNISFQNMLIHQTLISQKLIPDFSIKHDYNNLPSLTEAGLPKENVEDYEKIFDEEIKTEIEQSVLNGFIKETDKTIFREVLRDIINQFQKSFDSRKENYPTYKIESSISIVDGKKQIQGHNEKSRIELNNALNCLKERLFVSEDERFLFLNKTFYTREQKNWDSIELVLSNEKDIIIVDPYFFLSDTNGGKFGNRELIFLNAICKSDDEKDFVIVHQNCVCAEWLAEFSRRFKEGYNENELKINSHKKCNLTFIGVTLANKQSLHDRFIISNYRIIFSGHSFPLYFDEKGGFSANGSIGLSVGSVADGNNEHVMTKAIEYLQNEILDKELYNKANKRVETCYVYGDKNSKLLDLGRKERVEPIEGVDEVYKYGTDITLKKESNILCWENFYKDKDFDKFINKKVRIVNIKKNNNPRFINFHWWISFAYILDDNNKKEKQ